MNDTTIHLISGVPFDYADPDACEAITTHDVAHALARISRYGGHCVGEWSVAQHTLLVAQLVFGWYKGSTAEQIGALHHDDAEFVTGDWPTPMKERFMQLGLDYRRLIERPIEQAVCWHLGLITDDLHAGVVKEADNVAYEAEISLLKPGGHSSRVALDDDLMTYAQGFILRCIDYDVPTIEAGWLANHDRLTAGA